MANVKTAYRTHTCGELRMEQVGQTVTLAGFLENFREVGASLGFAVLRDFYGTTQVVAETEEMVKTIKALNKESTIAVTGVVRERDSKNPKLPTGDIEVVPQKIEVLGRCRHNELPFPPQRAAFPDQPQPGGRRDPAAEVPLSGPAQPGGQEQHHPPLPGGGRPALLHDRPRLHGDHHPHPDRLLPRGRP